MTDPTPRTAATARTMDEWVLELLEAVDRAHCFLVEHGAGDIFQFDPLEAIRTLHATAEAPGRVAALEADDLAAMMWDTEPVRFPERKWHPYSEYRPWAERILAALAAPAPPAGVSGEVCLWCGLTKEAPSPTPSEPVERADVNLPRRLPSFSPAVLLMNERDATPSDPVERCAVCGHESHDSALGCTFESSVEPDWFCACQHATPATRDE